MLKSIPILKIVSIGFIMSLIFLIPSCDQLLQPESAELVDENNDGYDDRDILFLQKLIDNSSADSTTTWEDVGGQIWTDGRLRSLYHQGGKPYGDGDGFFLYEIPREIEGAQYLNKLKLYKNYLTVIPDEIEYLDRLTEINLENNRFAGPVPEALWKNKNLNSLAINGNSFSSLPASVCDALENIDLFVMTHNSLCDIPECISDPGIQSCNCYDYQNISAGSICLDTTVSCTKYLTEITENCALKQIWGEENFNALTSLGSEACLEWGGGTCSEYASDTLFVEYPINIDLSVDALDCNDENPYLDYLGWLGDNTCDEEGAVNFSCEEFNCDLGDCGVWDSDLGEAGECSCKRDCSGTCFQNNSPACMAYVSDGWDCCLDDGSCEDISGDGVIIDFHGDGWCDDGTWGINFNCQEFDGIEFGCDGGDCGVWDEELGECVMPAGKTLKRRTRN